MNIFTFSLCDTKNMDSYYTAELLIPKKEKKKIQSRSNGNVWLTFWRFVIGPQIKWSLPCCYLMHNNTKWINITFRCAFVCPIVQSQKFWSCPKHLYDLKRKLNSNIHSASCWEIILLLQYAKLSAFSDSSSADELRILCNPKSVIFRTNLESTTQFEDFRFPCDFMSVVCKKCIP